MPRAVKTTDKVSEVLIRRILRAMMGGLPARYFDVDDMRKEAVRIVRIVRRFDSTAPSVKSRSR
jgi:hypothetical protein